jgi:hypothetical protein
MDVISFFVAHPKSTELVQPGESSFHHPPPSAQSATMLSVALREPGQNMTGAPTSSDCFGVITRSPRTP